MRIFKRKKNRPDDGIDRVGLFVDVLGVMNPKLADIVRLEYETTGETVRLGFTDDTGLTGTVPGTVLIDSPEDAVTVAAAGEATGRMLDMWAAAAASGRQDHHGLFLQILQEVNPDLLEVLRMEAATSGEDVVLKVTNDTDEAAFGEIRLDPASEDGMSVTYAAGVAGEMWELIQKHISSDTTDRPAGRRFFRRR